MRSNSLLLTWNAKNKGRKFVLQTAVATKILSPSFTQMGNKGRNLWNPVDPVLQDLSELLKGNCETSQDPNVGVRKSRKANVLIGGKIVCSHFSYKTAELEINQLSSSGPLMSWRHRSLDLLSYWHKSSCWSALSAFLNVCCCHGELCGFILKILIRSIADM